MQPTLQQIADEVGVSRMTVSRALRGVGRVSARTRDRVRKAARHAGYGGLDRCILGGPAHRGTSDHCLRLFVPVFTDGLSEGGGELGGEVLRGVRDRLGLNDGSLEVVACRDDADVLAAWQDLRANGVLLRRQLPQGWVRRLTRQGPVVYATSHDFYGDIDAVYVNEMRAATTLAWKLSRLGHRDIVWFGTFDRHDEGRVPDEWFEEWNEVDRMTASIHAPRYAAWAYLAHRQNATQNPLLLLERDWEKEPFGDMIARGGERLLKRATRPSAIVVPTTEFQQVATRCLMDYGVDVPADVSIVGYGLAPETGPGPAPTYVKLPMYDIGRVVPDLVERRLADPDAAPLGVLLEAELAEGETLAARADSPGPDVKGRRADGETGI